MWDVGLGMWDTERRQSEALLKGLMVDREDCVSKSRFFYQLSTKMMPVRI